MCSGVGDAVEVGDHTQRGDEIRLPHGSADLVIMNPPFIRPTNHAAGRDMPVPSFAGFGTSHDEQREMAKVLRKIRSGLKQPASHGHAGLASNFIDLAHAKVKPGGVIALVLPLAMLSGGMVRKACRLLARDHYRSAVMTIASTGSTVRYGVLRRYGYGRSALIFAVKAQTRQSAFGEADAARRVRQPA